MNFPINYDLQDWPWLQGWGFYVSGDYSWQCEPVDYSDRPVARRALNLAWWYFFSKAQQPYRVIIILQ